MNVPKLRFDGFSENWIKNTIQYFIDNKSIISHLDGNHGALYPKSNEFAKAGIPYITANDFITGRIDFNRCKYLPEAKAKLFKKGIARNGDVLFAHNATVGPCAILRTSFNYVILSTTATYYRCDLNKINNIFLLYFFQSDFFVSQYSSIMSQSTRNQVPITTQRKLSLALPTLSEQTKIANFLTAIDERITQLTQKYDLLKQYKKGVMQQIFSQKLRFKDEDGREFPRWKFKSLQEVCRRIMDGTHFSPKSKNGSKRYLTSKNIRNSGIDLSNCNYISDEEHQEIFMKCPVKIGDILLTKDGANTGNCCINSLQEEFSLLSSVAVLDGKADLVNNIFLLQVLQSQWGVNEINNAMAGQAISRITLEKINKFSFNFPVLLEQTKIANFLTAIDDKIAHTKTQLDAVKQYKKGLLQQLFV
ncbi:restriction endonuclease subunit S [Nitrosomonas sp.]|uniref:restriction endonuclease subunit S n=1 Tax=Nitrosomonas sp. TaxID=42353 RepID=UPI00374D3E6E